jgi:acyl CoA:acetate/3-ketoacid CoA transferase alpha subunit/acyl CoA:acetate/3-ketoacid CoA transferase beta subunit
MHLHFASSPSRSNVAIREVARQFRGKRPNFTLSTTGFHSTAHLLALLRLGKKYVSCFFGDNYPSPRPNALYADVADEGASLEHWSLLSYVAALRAGALGHSHATTTSLAGSSIAAELGAAGRYSEIADPNRPGHAVGLVAAMCPDVTFVHAAAADAEGNFIASPPYTEGFWGAFAATKGVIVSVERVVSAETIDRSSDWIKVPAYRVLAVCEEPYGAHPQPCYVAPREDVPIGYIDDFEQYELWRRMTTDASLFADFCKRVLDVRVEGSAYYDWVGKTRLAGLADFAANFHRASPQHAGGGAAASSSSFRAAAAASSSSLRAASAGSVPRTAQTGSARDPVMRPSTTMAGSSSRLVAASGGMVPLAADERLVLLAARTIVGRVIERGHEAILAGIGASFAAARMAALVLARGGRKIEVMVETGLVDMTCGTSADPFLLAWLNMAQARRLSSVEDVLGTLTCGAHNRCLGVLGAAEIDARGDINSTRLASGALLVGSGGANDIASSCSEVIAVLRCEAGKLVPRVHYVTSPGRAVSHIATDRCVLARAAGRDGWAVTSVYRDRPAIDEALAQVRGTCDFPDLDTSAASWAMPLSAEELDALAAIGDKRGRGSDAKLRVAGKAQ